MPKRKSPRKGSLQFWPRKRARKFLPRVNWDAIKTDSKQGLKGFIGYKAGMVSLHVKDDTEHSMTKGKRIVVPATIIECPPAKIFSIRLYKNGNIAKEILSDSIEKEMKKKLKLPKRKIETKINYEDYDDIRVIIYTQTKKTNIKKTPDLSEIGLKGSVEDKIKFVQENLGKEISILNVFNKEEMIDVRGLTKGKGLQGPVKRFGIALKSHKSEKGRRRPGSLGPWHPARVTFRVPMAGQLGMFTRVTYNSKILSLGKIGDVNSEFEKNFKNIKNYGDVKTHYIIIKGSVQGPSKRQILLTSALRPTKKTQKKKYEIIE